jgi:hypothetical protein
MKAITIKADTGQQDALEKSIAYVLLNMETCEDGLQIDGDLSNGIIVNRRQPDVWTVSFRPIGDDPSRRRRYRNPVAAARAVIRHEHNAEGG